MSSEQISVFPAGVDSTVPIRNLMIKPIFNFVKSNKYKGIIEKIRSTIDDEEKKRLKCTELGYVTFAGTFKQRKGEYILEPSGYMCIDIDDLNKEDLVTVKNVLVNDQYVLGIFLGPSGDGFKVIVRIPKTKDNNVYKQYYEQFSIYLKNKVPELKIKADENAKDIARACFLSYDPEAILKDDCELFDPEISEENIEPEQLNQYDNDKPPYAYVYPFFDEYLERLKNGSIELKNNQQKNDVLLKNYVAYVNYDMEKIKIFYSAVKHDISGAKGWIAKKVSFNPHEIKKWVNKYCPELLGYCIIQLPQKTSVSDHEEDNEDNPNVDTSFLGNDYNKDEVKERYDIEDFQKAIVNLLLAKKKRGVVTESIVNAITTFEHIKAIRQDEKKELWIYRRGIYIPEGRTYIEEWCRRLCGKGYQTSIMNDVTNKIIADNYIDGEKFFKAQNINHIAVENGILDISTNKLLEHTPEEYHFNKIPVVFDKSKDCPSIKKFFSSILEKPEDVITMQELFGYCLYRADPLQKSCIFWGKGSNGKSATHRLLKRFIGEKNCAYIELQEIQSDTFAISELLNKMVNIAGDIPSTELTEVNRFKILSGENDISANRKNKSRIGFKPYAKHFFSCNELPNITNTNDDAFWRRWVQIDFPYRFMSQVDYEEIMSNPEISETDKKKIRLKNPEVETQISTPDEMSGLLNWALAGLNTVLKNNQFTHSISMSKLKASWLRRSNSVYGFIHEHVVYDFDSKVSKGTFIHEYTKYCKENRLTPKTNLIKRTLENELNAWESRTHDGDYYWSGIRLKLPPENTSNLLIIDKNNEGQLKLC